MSSEVPESIPPEWLAQQFDLRHLSPDFYRNPYSYYHALREHEPVKKMPDGSYFLFTL